MPIVLTAALFLNSCKKDVPGCTNILSDNYNSSATVDDGSCYKYGCIDVESENYNISATIDDGSCIFPYEKFMGAYNCQETYTSSTCGSGTDQYSVVITKGAGNRDIIISGLGGGFGPIECKILGTSNFYNTETDYIQSPVGYFDVYIQNASYSNGVIIMNYQAFDFEYSNNCSMLEASVQMTKQ